MENYHDYISTCLKDPFFFIEDIFNYMNKSIQSFYNDDGEYYKLRAYQMDLFGHLLDNSNLNILKERQVGVSFLLNLYAMYDSYFNNKNILFVGKKTMLEHKYDNISKYISYSHIRMDDIEFNKNSYNIKFENSGIYFKSIYNNYDIQKIKSMKIDRIIIDDASTDNYNLINDMIFKFIEPIPYVIVSDVHDRILFDDLAYTVNNISLIYDLKTCMGLNEYEWQDFKLHNYWFKNYSYYDSFPLSETKW